MAPKKVAIIGGGYTGIAAYWALRHSPHKNKVFIFEGNDRLGSLIDTRKFQIGDEEWTVDEILNFFDQSSSPNVMAFLSLMKLDTPTINFSFSSSRHNGRLEYSWGGGLWRLYYWVKDALWRRDWDLLIDVFRFNWLVIEDVIRDYSRPIFYQGGELLNNPTVGGPSQEAAQNREETIREYLDDRGFSRTFRVNYLIPLIRVLWNVDDVETILNLPIKVLVRFLFNSKLIPAISETCVWRSIGGEEVDFVGEVTKKHIPRSRMFTKTPIASVKPDADTGRVFVSTVSGVEMEFDHVIFAVPGQEALRLLSSHATDEEKDILSGFQSKSVIAVLHTDKEFMPKSENHWAFLNYLMDRTPPVRPDHRFCITYDMRTAQRYRNPMVQPVYITVNPSAPIDPLKADAIWEYSRPVLNNSVIAHQRLLPKIQNTRGLSYCGSWTGFGRLEDGFRSAFKVAIDHLGAKIPFECVDSANAYRPPPDKTLLTEVFKLAIMLAFIMVSLLGLVKAVLLCCFRWRRREVKRNGIPQDEMDE